MILTLLVGLGGGLLGLWLRLPAGALMGSMLAVAALGLTGWLPGETIPPTLKDLAKILIGTVVGSTVTVGTLQALREAAMPALVLTGVLVAAALAGGWVLSLVTKVDIATALFATAPGGSAEMTAAAESMGADARLVAALQTIRVVVVIVVVPALLAWWFKP
jgi:membrane AbrB-like protein